ncbi:MAG: hypothetical protein ACLSAP_02675 [Oscillospiraceae bacterium]
MKALQLSRAVIRNIRENLFWAFFYNVIGIPLAAGVFYPLLQWKLSPMFGAAREFKLAVRCFQRAAPALLEAPAAGAQQRGDGFTF